MVGQCVAHRAIPAAAAAATITADATKLAAPEPEYVSGPAAAWACDAATPTVTLVPSLLVMVVPTSAWLFAAAAVAMLRILPSILATAAESAFRFTTSVPELIETCEQRGARMWREVCSVPGP